MNKNFNKLNLIQIFKKRHVIIKHMIDEVSVYDMKVFSTVILYISGNDAANKKNPEWIEEKFEELINLIKYSNNDCRVIATNLGCLYGRKEAKLKILMIFLLLSA